MPQMKPLDNALLFLIAKAKSFLRRVPDDFKLIGQVLIQKSIITEPQLRRALTVQRERLARLGRADFLGTIIVELGQATEQEMVSAINQHYGLEVTCLSESIREHVKEKRKDLIVKRPGPRVPIWLQLSAATTVLIALAIFVLGYVILERQKDQLHDQTVKIGAVSLTYFANNARIPLLEDNLLSLNTLIGNANDIKGLDEAFIVDRQQIIKAHTDPTQIGKLAALGSTQPKSAQRLSDRDIYHWVSTNKNYQVLRQAISFQDKYLGYVQVLVSIEFIEELIRKERIFIILSTLLIIFFGIVVAALMGFSFSRPISKLVEATREIREGNYNFKVQLYRNDELGTFAAAFNQMSEDLWQKSLMEKSFGRYVGPEVLEMIMSQPESPWLKGHKNDAAILFADMRGFTAYSEAEAPEQVIKTLNEYFEIATRCILDYDGYIDKFIGDAVLGIFGVPVYHSNHEERAVRAALKIQQQLKESSLKGLQHLSAIGIGIDAGEVVAGNLGSQSKMEYTVIGDCVNVASRLNAFAGPGEVVISGDVYEAVQEIVDVEQMAKREIKGKSKSVDVYKVLGLNEKGLSDVNLDQG